MSVFGSVAFEFVMILCCAVLFWFIRRRRQDTINQQMNNIRSQFTHGNKSPEIAETSPQAVPNSPSEQQKRDTNFED